MTIWCCFCFLMNDWPACAQKRVYRSWAATTFKDSLIIIILNWNIHNFLKNNEERRKLLHNNIRRSAQFVRHNSQKTLLAHSSARRSIFAKAHLSWALPTVGFFEKSLYRAGQAFGVLQLILGAFRYLMRHFSIVVRNVLKKYKTRLVSCT